MIDLVPYISNDVVRTGLTSVNPTATSHGNTEGYEAGQPQACPVETHRRAEALPEPALGAHRANTPRILRIRMKI